MIEFFENYPVLTAILVAVLSWLAIAWELFGLQEKFLAICTTMVGTAVVVGSFGAAQKTGSVGIAGVAITLVTFLAACAWIWSRWLSNKKTNSLQNK